MSAPAPVVVIIEDDGDIRTLLISVLEASGYRVHAASSGTEGLALIDSVGPDVITLDVSMPVMDGFETAIRIRERYTTPIVMISARADERSLAHADEIGVDAFVTKPFRPRELRERLAALLAAPR